MTTSCLPMTLGATVQPGEVFFAIMPWMLILTGIVIVGWLLLVFIRRSTGDGDSSLDDGFTLGQLRKMRERGEMSDEEFEQARNVILGQHAPRSVDTMHAGSPGSDTVETKSDSVINGTLEHNESTKEE